MGGGEGVEEARAVVLELESLLDSPRLEPVAAVVARASPEVDRVERLIDDRLLVCIQSGAYASSAGNVDVLAAAIAALARAAAVAEVAGEPGTARRWLSAARHVAHETDRPLLDEALADLSTFAELCRVEWNARRGDVERARDLAKPLAARRGEFPAMASAAGVFAHAPVPVSRTPGLRRIARSWWLGVATVAIGVAIATGIYVYRHSSFHRLRVALADADRSAATAHDAKTREAALGKYEHIIESFLAEKISPGRLEPAGAAAARLIAAGVPNPLPADEVETALRALDRFQALPAAVRAGVVAQWMSETVGRWDVALSGTEDARASARLRLLERGSRACDGAQGGALGERLAEAKLAFAGRLAGEWPFAAIRLYASLGQRREAIIKNAALIARIDDKAVSVLGELAPALEDWASAVRALGVAEQAELAKQVGARVSAARTYLGSAERQDVLASDDERKIAAALDAMPADQELAVALSDLRREDGAAVALGELQKLGAPGQMVLAAQVQLADVLEELGRGEEAEALLEQVVEQRLPEYESTHRAYADAADKREAELLEKANAGKIPDDVAKRTQGLGGDEAEKVLREWIDQELDQDPRLQALLARAKASSDVVPAVIALGNSELTRANDSSGKDQERLLAQAERNFLAIRSTAEGTPSFQLGLGQVLYRLGRAEEGDREFTVLLEQNDPTMTLSVARAYREVGAQSRAEAICEKLFETAASPFKERAAFLRSLMADSHEERREWLLRSDQEDDLVKTGLLELDAETLYEAGKLTEADRKYAAVAATHLKTAARDDAATNNAAIATERRYACTGNAAHLDEAIRLMESAMRLSPDSSLLLANVIPIYEQRAYVSSLKRWLRVETLRLDDDSAVELVRAIMGGDRETEILAALERSRDVKRARDLAHRVQVLAPTLVDGYLTEVTWLERFKDEAGLRTLHERLVKAPLDTVPAAKRRREWLAGDRDAVDRERLHHEVTNLETTASKLDPKRDAPSLAAVRVLEAEARRTLSMLEEPRKHNELEVQALREADELWPAIGAANRLDAALLRLAVRRAAEESKELAPIASRELREFGVTIMIAGLLSAKKTDLLAAVTRQPEFAQALEAARRNAPKRPDPLGWVLGRMADDAALLAASRDAFNERERLSMECDALVNPDSTDAPYRELFRTAAASYAH